MKFISTVRICFLLVALLATGSAGAQKQSLAERVATLEQKTSSQTQGASQANVELLNRLTQLQSEMKALRDQVETLQNENAQLKERNRVQYIDLDSRIGKFETSGVPANPAPATATARPNVSKPAVKPAVSQSTNNSGNAVATDPANEEAAYGVAFEALKQKDYVESARLFKTFIDTYPQAQLAPNAWYWLGESYYVTQNYEIARQSFEGLLSQFPDSGKVPDGMLKLGYCQAQLGQKDRARNTFNEVLRLYPMSDAARFAQSQLRAMNLGQ
ncbi:MAG TPA: tol-pal system protein YbgF [Arenimonas sp.]|nr:tol-pal system protein YbgF [Arenimonas sp.]